MFKKYAWIVNNGPCCISPGISDQILANDNTQRLATTETTAQHGNFNLLHFQNDQMTGQHDRQDERLTGQLPNRFIHCPLTGRYFEPCFWINLFVCDWLQSSDSAVIVKKNKGLIAWLKTCHNQWIGNSWMKVLNHLVSNIVNEKFASSYCNVNLGK